MASRILSLLRERRQAAYATLAVFLLSFFFIVYTRISNPISSFSQDLEPAARIADIDPVPNSNPHPNPISNPSPVQAVDDSQIREEQKDPNPSPNPNPDTIAAPVPSPSPIQVADSSQVKEEQGGDDSVEGFELQWGKCKDAQAVDYIPCLDNRKAIKELKSMRHMEHRERHCPKPSPRCLVPLPRGYKVPVPWPKSRDMIWYDNVPHPKLVEYKKEQNWVQKSGDYFIFPGGGTQFKGGVTKYIQFIEQVESH